MRPHYRTTLLASLLALVCAGALWAAYDWFQGRYLRAFSSHTALFSGDPLSLPANLAGPGAIRVVHFWDRHARATSAINSTWPNCLSTLCRKALSFMRYRSPVARVSYPVP